LTLEILLAIRSWAHPQLMHTTAHRYSHDGR
jgi:hypothetical protein